jgi:ribosome-binding factor A
MSPGHRPERIAELIKEELSIMVALEMRDERLQTANVTAVKVSPDLRHARVFVSHDGPPEEDRQVLAALRHAVGYLRRGLSERVILRYVPELTFEIDRTPAQAARVEQILDRLRSERSAGPVAPAEEK